MTQSTGPHEDQAASRPLSADQGAAPLSDTPCRQEGQSDGCRTNLDPQREIGGIRTPCRADQANGCGCAQADGDPREPGQPQWDRPTPSLFYNTHGLPTFDR